MDNNTNRGASMKKIGKVLAKVLVVAVAVTFIAITGGKAQKVQAASNEHFNDSPTMGVGYIDISAKHLYYDKKGNLHAELYVYNGLPYTIYELDNLHLHIDNGDVDIADKTISVVSCNMTPGMLSTYTVTFKGKKDHITNAVLSGGINVTNECEYKY
jgi:hypothetical protein